MKVLQIKQPGGFENLQLVERDDPIPSSNEVLVRWKATSLNFHDFLVAKGLIPVADNRVPMSDGAGEVLAVGAEVTKWKVGDKVMSLFFPEWINGRPSGKTTKSISGESVDGYALEKSCIHESAVTAIPKGYTYAEAATLPCAAVTAWRALEVEGKIKPGDKVLIEGTGGVSIFALQIALSVGAEVFATSSSDQKAERLKQMGVKAVVNYKEDPKWGKTIYKMCGGVDHVLDVGGGATMKQSIEAATMNGHISSIGILGGRSGEITFPKLFFKHLRLTGIAVGSRSMQEELVRSINKSSWKPMIDKSFALSELGDAFEYQATGQHFGKIVLEY